MFPKLLRRDIILLICIKALALSFIYYEFVAPVSPPQPDGAAMAAHLLRDSGN